MHYALKITFFAVTVQLDNIKAKNRPKKSKYETQAIPLKFWYRILVPDFPKVPANSNRSATLIENPTNCKQIISGFV